MLTEPLIEPVRIIVLTGGPCSGKTSSLAYLTERLSDHGFMVFTVPETATLISINGIDRRKMDRARQVVMYEEAILDMQLSFEETYARAVNRIFPDKKKVLLLDRGVMDIKAFVSKEDFRGMLRRKALKEVGLRDRYHGVIHLVTAAEGAEAYYTGENNEARIETPEEAILLDRKIRESWLGHPHFRIIDNRTDFGGKMRRAFGAISQLLGMPAPSAVTERFIVGRIDRALLPAHQDVRIEQTYLRPKNHGEEICIKKRGQDDSYLFFLMRTRHTPYTITEEELIDEQQFSTLKKLIDPKTNVLVKERACFFWNNRHFELDTYRGAYEGLSVLGVEPIEAGTAPDRAAEGQEGATGANEARLSLPPFVSVERAITSNPRYSERAMALKKMR